MQTSWNDIVLSVPQPWYASGSKGPSFSSSSSRQAHTGLAKRPSFVAAWLPASGGRGIGARVFMVVTGHHSEARLSCTDEEVNAALRGCVWVETTATANVWSPKCPSPGQLQMPDGANSLALFQPWWPTLSILPPRLRSARFQRNSRSATSRLAPAPPRLRVTCRYSRRSAA